MSSLWLKTRLLITVAAFAIITFSTSFALADIVASNTVGGIPDNDATGVSSSVTIADNETINGISVSLNGIGHSWVGDLVVTLQGPQGQSITIMDRTGTGAFDDSSNLAATFQDGGLQSYRFVDTGESWWDEASAGDTFYDMLAGNYRASDSNGSPINMNAVVAGASTAGTWTLNITDNAAGDSGNIVSWTVAFSSSAASVPEPASLGLIAGLSTLLLRRRRRS